MYSRGVPVPVEILVHGQCAPPSPMRRTPSQSLPRTPLQHGCIVQGRSKKLELDADINITVAPLTRQTSFEDVALSERTEKSLVTIQQKLKEFEAATAEQSRIELNGTNLKAMQSSVNSMCKDIRAGLETALIGDKVEGRWDSPSKCEEMRELARTVAKALRVIQTCVVTTADFDIKIAEAAGIPRGNSVRVSASRSDSATGSRPTVAPFFRYNRTASAERPRKYCANLAVTSPIQRQRLSLSPPPMLADHVHQSQHVDRYNTPQRQPVALTWDAPPIPTWVSSRSKLTGDAPPIPTWVRSRSIGGTSRRDSSRGPLTVQSSNVKAEEQVWFSCLTVQKPYGNGYL